MVKKRKKYGQGEPDADGNLANKLLVIYWNFGRVRFILKYFVLPLNFDVVS